MSFGLDQGTIFAGRYRVIACIAVGGMGAVYEVRHVATARHHALKVMLPQTLQDAELRARFKLEARVAAKVDSEFIVSVFDAGVDDDTEMPFLVMELLKGEDLGKLVKREGRLEEARVVTYLHQTALALDKTHKASIVHRDLKPDNLFLTLREAGQPQIKVLDFGVAKVVAAGAAATGGTVSLGTPMYMSPEQFNPDAELTGSTDIYALGMIAYTLLVGAPYWDIESKSGNVVTFAMTAADGPLELASQRAARHGVSLPPTFDAWFSRITSVDPAQRHPTATAAVAALAEALGLPSTWVGDPHARSPSTWVGDPHARSPSTWVGDPHARSPSPQVRPPSSKLLESGSLPTQVYRPGAGARFGSARRQARRRGAILTAGLLVGVAVLGGGAFVLQRLSRRGVPAFADLAAPSTAAAAPVTASAAPPESAAPPVSAAAASSEPAAPTAELAVPAPPATVSAAPTVAPAAPAMIRTATAASVASPKTSASKPAVRPPKTAPEENFTQE